MVIPTRNPPSWMKNVVPMPNGDGEYVYVPAPGWPGGTQPGMGREAPVRWRRTALEASS